MGSTTDSSLLRPCLGCQYNEARWWVAQFALAYEVQDEYNSGNCGKVAPISAPNVPPPSISVCMAEETTQHDPLFLQGIQHFNECDFYEAHEIWEELWTEYRGEARKFYQGLIQVAVALHHFGNGNVRGAKKVYLTSRNYLEEYPATYHDFNLQAFLEQYEHCFTEILNSSEEFPEIEIDPELIPEIHLLQDS